MPIIVSWFNEEKTIASYQLVGRWTWDDLYAAVQESRAMVMGVNHPVYFIIDVTKNHSVPPGALTHLRSITAGVSPNWKMGVFVGVNTFVETLLKTFIKVYPKFGERYTIASTIEEAQAFIATEQSRQIPTQKPE